MYEDDESLPAKLREEARSLSLQRRGQELLDNAELKQLCLLLDKYHSPPNTTSNHDQLINYQDLKKVIQQASPKCRLVKVTSEEFDMLANTGLWCLATVSQAFHPTDGASDLLLSCRSWVLLSKEI